MENENIPQPLDALMTRLGLTNADLVKASTEQLSFKMVQKGRKGRRLTSNIQEKIQNALMAAKPGVQFKRRDLFRYEMDETVVEQIKSSLEQFRTRKIDQSQLTELLLQAGIVATTTEVALNRVTYFGTAGKAYVEQGPAISVSTPGRYDENAVRSAFADAQEGILDPAAFLKRIYDAGIIVLEVNLRSRKIDYKGEDQFFRESLLAPQLATKTILSKAAGKKKDEKKPKKAKKNKKKSMTRKARMSFKKIRFKRRKQASGRK